MLHFRCNHHYKPPHFRQPRLCSCVCELVRICVGALLRMSCVVAYIVPWCVCHELVHMSNVCAYVVRSYVCLCVFRAYILCVCRALVNMSCVNAYFVHLCVCRAFVHISYVCLCGVFVCMYVYCVLALMYLCCAFVCMYTAMAEIIRPRDFL